jgi:hypothetical protein
MKTKTYIFSLLLLFYFSSFSQNYKSNFGEEDWLCVYPNKKVYFKDTDNFVYCLRIDSTFNNDSILYPFSDLHQIDYECYSITAGSWLSKYIVFDEEGNTIFINGENQSILIKNKAELNEVWDVFTNNDIKVEGKVTSLSLKSILGLEDSIKTISFFVYNLNNEAINHTLNQFSIEVSKHFGLVKTVNFYYFEHSTDDYHNHSHSFDAFNLIGINEPQLGFQNINLREQYFDFQEGDELHFQEFYNSFLYLYYDKKIIHKYLSRSDHQDSIVYSYECKSHNEIRQYINGVVATDIYTTLDTLKQKIVKDFMFTTEPNEPYNEYGDKVVTTTEQMFFKYSDLSPSETCLHPMIVDGGCSGDAYYIGLGGPYYECYGWDDARKYRRLLYYKKGNIESGTPFDFVTLTLENSEDPSVAIYPNPVENMLNIASSAKILLVELFDMSSKKLFSQMGKNAIDVSSYPKGQYILKVQEANGSSASFVVVKK